MVQASSEVQEPNKVQVAAAAQMAAIP